MLQRAHNMLFRSQQKQSFEIICYAVHKIYKNEKKNNKTTKTSILPFLNKLLFS